MPAFMNVFDDPSVAKVNGIAVNGFYRDDNEGIAGQKASLVEAGVLKTFLLGRSPTRGFTLSNGHGRRQAGRSTTPRQGNLVVAPSTTVSRDALRKMLLDEVKKQGKPYGLIVRELDGGFTLTTRFEPQSFKLLPIMMFRLYPDGREELVRGADIEGTPLKALADIVAADDQVKTFNGYCGAESGYVPVSATSPQPLDLAPRGVEEDARHRQATDLVRATVEAGAAAMNKLILISVLCARVVEAGPFDDPVVRALDDELGTQSDDRARGEEAVLHLVHARVDRHDSRCTRRSGR